MPRVRKKYSQVISAAITDELYRKILDEAEIQDRSLSTIIRRILEGYYNIKRSGAPTITRQD